MFCGSTHAVQLVQMISTHITPDCGVLHITQYDFREDFLGTAHLRVAILRMSLVKVKTTFGNDRWPDLALQVVNSQVRFLAHVP